MSEDKKIRLIAVGEGQLDLFLAIMELIKEFTEEKYGKNFKTYVRNTGDGYEVFAIKEPSDT